MEINFKQCNAIMQTLPIGFYAGRRIGVELAEDKNTSYYSPLEDAIVISYPIIERRMRMIKDGTCEVEEAIRSMLYHEVSHALITPATSLHNSYAVNCFEDERIESVLRHYFFGVNFRKQLYDLHGGNAPEVHDTEGAFFNAVRFGLGTGKVQQTILRMLKKYAALNRASARYDGDPCCSDYERAIENLWNLIEEEFKNHPKEFQPQGQPGEGSGMGSLEDEIKNIQVAENKDSEQQDKIISGASQMMKDKFPHEIGKSIEDVRGMVNASLDAVPDLQPEEIEQLHDFQHSAEIIINNFNKKNSGGSGINTYNGVFNPRAVVRKDYRYFERAMSTQGNNKFGTCHLNLIIDCSGSFRSNEAITNGILQVMTRIERKNKNFSMDVAFINHTFQMCEKIGDRVLHARGGNTIPENMKNILMKMQKPQTCNYNIVLFDGDALTDNYENHIHKQKLFSVFDMKQTTLITDPDNERYMETPFTSTKVVVTRDYTDKLIDNILRALTIAFG